MAPSGGTIVRRRRVVVVSKPVGSGPKPSNDVLRPKRVSWLTRFARRWWRVLVPSAVLLAVVGGLLIHDEYSSRELASARSDALAAARVRLPVMMSYNYESIDADLELASGNTTGKFRQNYTRLFRDEIAPYATQNKVTNSVVVTDASVVSGDQNDVVVRLAITQTVTTEGGPPPNPLRRLIRVTMSKTHEGWFVSRLTQA